MFASPVAPSSSAVITQYQLNRERHSVHQERSLDCKTASMAAKKSPPFLSQPSDRQL